MYLYVYGTLKKGKNNHGYLSGATFMGNFTTSGDFSLIVSGLPFLVKRPSRSGVRGEVYKIDSDTLRRIDRLEGTPDFYLREVITVNSEDTKESLDVYAYTHPDVFIDYPDADFKICREF